ncbi:Ketosteroid isomerase-related protein [Saccharopolyspora flava]|uniref:Ketosteroid isomerase-related protein n=1 Tax=Saccharopolyspora flava TaxID=95161 RepID=A0A1I6TND9_9PSEU|nr:Ketosteroid isomerase-related protein [Saccharopolyspora flava]
MRSYYDMVDLGDVEGLLQLFSESAVYRRPGYAPLVGRAELRAFYASQRVIDHGRHELTELVSEPGKVAVRGTFSGTLKDRSTLDVDFADFFVLEPSGRFSRRDTFFYVPAV